MGIIQTILGANREDQWGKLIARAKREEATRRDPARQGAVARRLATRHMDELIGLCQGILFDGAVSDVEAKNLLKWVESHRDAAETWPGNVLYERICRALVDGKVDADEEKELLDVLGKVAGGLPDHNAPRAASAAIPFDDPVPPIEFAERAFCMTGVFVYGARRDVESVIVEKGGRITAAPSGKTHYLVVGTFSSEEWLHSTHGTKILKAVELKRAGKSIAIVTEKHWIEHV